MWRWTRDGERHDAPIPAMYARVGAHVAVKPVGAGRWRVRIVDRDGAVAMRTTVPGFEWHQVRVRVQSLVAYHAQHPLQVGATTPSDQRRPPS